MNKTIDLHSTFIPLAPPTKQAIQEMIAHITLYQPPFPSLSGAPQYLDYPYRKETRIIKEIGEYLFLSNTTNEGEPDSMIAHPEREALQDLLFLAETLLPICNEWEELLTQAAIALS
jgi:hypothetical protein